VGLHGFVALTLAAGLSSACARNVAQLPASPVPVIFGAGVISTAAPEFSIAISATMGEAYYNRASADRRVIDVMQSRLENGAWQPGVRVLTDTFRNVDPFLSPDGRRLYFSSNRPATPDDAIADYNTWYLERADRNAAWSAPRPVGAYLDTDSTEIYVSLDRTNTMYFASNRDGASRIYSSTWRNGQYLTAIQVPFEGNATIAGGNPGVSPDGTMLVFVRGNGAASDMYLTCRDAGSSAARRGDAWSGPVRLANDVNSDAADFTPSFSADGRSFFFTSERPGIVPAPPAGERPPGDIYYISASVIRAQCPR
jgi:Tol biopolymer transport system component